MLFQIPRELFDPLCQFVDVKHQGLLHQSYGLRQHFPALITLRVENVNKQLSWSWVNSTVQPCHALIAQLGDLLLLSSITNLSEFKQLVQTLRVKNVNDYMKQAPLANVGVGS